MKLFVWFSFIVIMTTVEVNFEEGKYLNTDQNMFDYLTKK